MFAIDLAVELSLERQLYTKIVVRLTNSSNVGKVPASPEIISRNVLMGRLRPRRNPLR